MTVIKASHVGVVKKKGTTPTPKPTEAQKVAMARSAKTLTKKWAKQKEQEQKQNYIDGVKKTERQKTRKQRRKDRKRAAKEGEQTAKSNKPKAQLLKNATKTELQPSSSLDASELSMLEYSHNNSDLTDAEIQLRLRAVKKHKGIL